MQISDYVSQYNQNINPQAEPAVAKKGVEHLVSSIRQMTVGNIFEGTVNSIKNGKVVLGLSNGKELIARIDGKVGIQAGQSMFFQVKSNDGSLLAIKPFTVDGSRANLTLMNALKATNLPVDVRNLSMVNRMMEEQMPIDKNSLMQMARIAMAHPDIDIQTLVQMQKLHLPISAESASQFENYLANQQAITNDLDAFMSTLPQTMADDSLSLEQLTQINNQLLTVITEDAGQGMQMQNSDMLSQAAGAPAGEVSAEGTAAGPSEVSVPQAQTAVNPSEVSASSAQNAANPSEASASQVQTAADPSDPSASTAQNAANKPETSVFIPERAVFSDKAMQPDTVIMQPDADDVPLQNQAAGGAALTDTQAYQPGTLGSLFDKTQMFNLYQQIAANPQLADRIEQSLGQPLDENTQIQDLLSAFKDALSSGTFTQKTALQKLFGGKEMQSLIKESLKQQWTIRPEELPEQGKVRELYEKIDHQVKSMEEAVRSSGGGNENFHQAAAQIKNNISFMNQVNEIYTYVQIPVKMSGQTANGELYVYTNKKNLSDPERDLTAFLHLDMEHLGSTDVSLKMHKKEVSANFYFDNDESFALVKEHVPELEERLRKKGYNCRISVANEAKHVNFVEDFLKKDQPSTGTVRRYSFDMRA